MKFTASFALLICIVTSFSVSAQPYIKLGNFNKIELDEHNLWFKTKPVDTPPNFSELSLLYQHANQVPSALGGSGAFVTKINLSNTKDEKNTWFVNIHMNYLDIGTAYWQPIQGEAILLEQFGQLDGENPKLAHSQVFSLPLIDKESGTLWIYVQAKMFPTPRFYQVL
jgi:hypothetical protein